MTLHVKARLTAVAAAVFIFVPMAGARQSEPAAPPEADGAAPEEASSREAEPVVYERPKFQLERWKENWSILRDWPEEQKADIFDGIKHVPLSEDGSVWASFGGHARLRFEGWNNFGFGPTNDDTFLLSRATLHGDFHFGKNLRVFAEGKTAWVTDRDLPGGRRTLDVDSIDLEQLFFDAKFDFGESGEDGLSLVIRPGRQWLTYGKQRLISPLEWSNTYRRWDGVSGWLDVEEWRINGFWAEFVPVRKYDFNKSDADRQLFGVYATSPDYGTWGMRADLYFIGLDNGNTVTFNGTTGTEKRYTTGGRLFGPIPGSLADYDFEGAYQFGEVGSGDVRAFMIGSQFGFRFVDEKDAPRVYLGFDYGSGDRNPGGDVQTFNQLFPLGHAYLGYIDIVGRQNIFDFNLGITFKPAKTLTAEIAGHFFWRDEPEDALYNAGGGVVRPGAPGTSREVGQEIDTRLAWKLDRHTSFLFGYSHFFRGNFISETGGGSDIDFVYAQVRYTF